MSQLSAQSIKKLCQPSKFFGLVKQQPMLVPFIDHKVVHEVSGRSYGLSAATYDVRIDHDLILTPYGKGSYFALANTMEDFFMPHNVCAYVVDKSTFARVFVTAFNTFIDPGFQGNLTLELVNLGDSEVVYTRGDPVCQIAFHWLDRKTDRPYTGKYSRQPKRPVGARMERSDGTFEESTYGKRGSTNRG